MTFRRNNPVAVSANFLDNVADIAVGAYATYARMADGTVKQWGDTDGSSPILSPTTVPGLTGVALVAPGDRFACALKTDGTVWCCGINWAAGLGSSGPVAGSQPTPVQVPGISGAIDLAAGSSHVCAIAKSSGGGAISCWGYNGVGELGDGTTTSSSIPRGVSMGGAQTYAGRIFAGGLHTCALGSDGRVACWGENANGELGDGTTISRSSPTFLSGLGDTVDIALGFYHACALGGDGVTRCWGDNGSGQIGDGTFAQRLTPV